MFVSTFTTTLVNSLHIVTSLFFFFVSIMELESTRDDLLHEVFKLTQYQEVKEEITESVNSLYFVGPETSQEHFQFFFPDNCLLTVAYNYF